MAGMLSAQLSTIRRPIALRLGGSMGTRRRMILRGKKPCWTNVLFYLWNEFPDLVPNNWCHSSFTKNKNSANVIHAAHCPEHLITSIASLCADQKGLDKSQKKTYGYAESRNALPVTYSGKANKASPYLSSKALHWRTDFETEHAAAAALHRALRVKELPIYESRTILIHLENKEPSTKVSISYLKYAAEDILTACRRLIWKNNVERLSILCFWSQEGELRKRTTWLYASKRTYKHTDILTSSHTYDRSAMFSASAWASMVYIWLSQKKPEATVTLIRFSISIGRDIAERATWTTDPGLSAIFVASSSGSASTSPMQCVFWIIWNSEGLLGF